MMEKCQEKTQLTLTMMAMISYVCVFYLTALRYDSPEGKKGRQVFLGSFPTERAAARGHDIAVLRHNR